jgi:hypothetical protein
MSALVSFFYNEKVIAWHNMIEETNKEILRSPQLFPFPNYAIGTRIQRLSVSYRSGDRSEVKQILRALELRNQKIIHGFESFVATKSDFDILKALEPLLSVIPSSDISKMERVLLKYSKFHLIKELLAKAYRIHDLHSDGVGMRFASFSDFLNIHPVENFYYAIDFFLKNQITLRRIDSIFVFEKVLMMNDAEVIDLINNLVERGIPVMIRKPFEEIDSNLTPLDAYRPVTLIDFRRDHWYGELNQTPWINSYRDAIKSFNALKTDDALELVKELFTNKNNFSKIVNLLMFVVSRNKLDISLATTTILSQLESKDSVSVEPFVSWCEFVAENGNTYLQETLSTFARRINPETNKPILVLNYQTVDGLLESREWKSVHQCIKFMRVLSGIQNSPKPANSVLGSFLLNLGFATDPESILLFENELGRKLSIKEFSLGTSGFEENFDENKFFSWLEFGKKFDYLDERIAEKIYKIGLIHLNSRVLEFVINSDKISSSKRSAIRHQLLRNELSSGAFENGKDLFELASTLKDTDEFDPVILVQNSYFENFTEVEAILSNHIARGGEIDVKTLGSLCNRYARNNRYEDVLRILDVHRMLYSAEDTILELYRLAALANLNREADAYKVLDGLLKSRNQFLIEKYAPSILKKIENKQLNSFASALNFELTNIERPVSIRKVVENSSGIVRNKSFPLVIKKMYESQCQVCRIALNTPFGPIAEAAHIQGLGYPHYGSDDLTNLLCLCPNHHKLFDNSGWYLSDDLQVIDTISKNVVADLFVLDKHELSLSAISYQRNYAINASSKGQRAWK